MSRTENSSLWKNIDYSCSKSDTNIRALREGGALNASVSPEHWQQHDGFYYSLESRPWEKVEVKTGRQLEPEPFSLSLSLFDQD
jgi:hypothetical protein